MKTEVVNSSSSSSTISTTSLIYSIQDKVVDVFDNKSFDILNFKVYLL